MAGAFRIDAASGRQPWDVEVLTEFGGAPAVGDGVVYLLAGNIQAKGDGTLDAFDGE